MMRFVMLLFMKRKNGLISTNDAAFYYLLKEEYLMQTQKGTVSKIRIVSFAPSPLVRFTLGTTNCLIAKHSLNFLGDVDEGMFLTVGGYWNKRHQFVVQKYTVYGKTKIMLDIDAYRQKTVKAGSL